ncbi:MAG: glycosyltransferase [Chloroflexi bacterium]|nr:MAG: glycosyltransferase [Chloroflexota bacterium]
MKTAVIIPSLNSPLIDQVIHALLGQQTKPSEIVIVGKDELHLIPTEAPVRFIDTGKPVSASVARNIGIQATTNDLLLFLDSDCLPEPTWLEEHLKAHAAGHLVVGGGVLPKGSNYWSLSYNLTLFHEFYTTAPAGPRQYLPTLNLSVQRQVIEKVGLLNETLARGQDIEWTARMKAAGYPLYFWPQAAVDHQHNRTNFRSVWRDCARSGYHMRQVRLDNPEQIEGPNLLQYRPLILGLSPVIAAWATSRILWKRPSTFKQHWQTIPAIYLTKIAWCWGASRTTEPV